MSEPERADRLPKDIGPENLYDYRTILPVSALEFLDQRARSEYKKFIGNVYQKDLGRKQTLVIRRTTALWVVLGEDPASVDKERLYDVFGRSIRGEKIRYLYKRAFAGLDHSDYLIYLTSKLGPEVLSFLNSLDEQERNRFVEADMNVVSGDPQLTNPKRGVAGIRWGTNPRNFEDPTGWDWFGRSSEERD
ncbi:hypothetical protein HYT59_02620 [Candidatus Woesebacteria bacterium]|nr:hypothetical protein [Candidatus Woesebacteria bacterium]